MIMPNKILLLLATFFIIAKTQAQCNASNSPTFQVTTTQGTLAVNNVCGVFINIVNANTVPPGGPVSFSFMTPGQSSVIVSPTPTIAMVSGVYTVQVMDNSNFCLTSQTVQINVLAAPSLSLIASNTLVCLGSIAILTASGASSYKWSTNATTSSISITATATTSYSVIGTGTNGCGNTASLVVEVSPLPSVTVTAPQSSVCLNQGIQLSAQGADTYTWNTTATGSSYTSSAFTSTGNINYSVQLQSTSSLGCVATKTVFISLVVMSCETVGMNEYGKSHLLKIYPNPVKDMLNVEIICEEIKILDLTGKEIMCVKNSDYINLNELIQGFYFVKIGSDMTKFLKE